MALPRRDVSCLLSRFNTRTSQSLFLLSPPHPVPSSSSSAPLLLLPSPLSFSSLLCLHFSRPPPLPLHPPSPALSSFSPFLLLLYRSSFLLLPRAASRWRFICAVFVWRGKAEISAVGAHALRAVQRRRSHVAGARCAADTLLPPAPVLLSPPPLSDPPPPNRVCVQEEPSLDDESLAKHLSPPMSIPDADTVSL